VAHVLREKDANFRIKLEEVPVVRTGDREADVIATTANLQAALERNIRERPGEWMWGHRRWG
jgi:KDO2-lipid IV(A) lauroyltransferase